MFEYMSIGAFLLDSSIFAGLVLCLHGYRQDAGFFKEKFGAFRKIVKNTCELVFIDAPHVIPDDDSAEGSCLRPGRGWWFSCNDSTFNPLEDSNVCLGFEESIQLIDATFKTQGPFDGILGFSQGAAMAALLCVLQEKQEFHHSFQFVILIAGFISKSSYHKSLFTIPTNVQSLHITGENDRVIPKNMSEELSQYFKSPKIIYHPGGHFLPTSSNYKVEYLGFLNEMLKQKQLANT